MQTSSGPQSGLSNEMLCILAAQGTDKLPAIKLEGQKKM
jgi:hypothetical protein